MTEQNIANIIRQRRRYESELLILQDCTDNIHDPDDTASILRYALIKRRLALIDHWLHLLPLEESELLQAHLIQRQSWKAIAEQSVNDPTRVIVCDARSLQRIQAKALKRLEAFVKDSFGSTLDYLIDNEDSDEVQI